MSVGTSLFWWGCEARDTEEKAELSLQATNSVCLLKKESPQSPVPWRRNEVNVKIGTLAIRALGKCLRVQG